MNIIRSFLFVPADKKKMLGKIFEIDSDAFILDLEDSVSIHEKETARNNILSVIPMLKKNRKNVFIRINRLGTVEAENDIEKVFHKDIEGYVIPKFENIETIKKFVKKLEMFEKEISCKKKSLILMIESPASVLEIRRLNLKNEKNIADRLIGLALGGEDYMESLSISRKISKDVLDSVRKEIILFARSNSLLAIDTVYPEYKNIEGLKAELSNIISIGFTSKFAIHPSQTIIINESFYPDEKDIEKMKLILSFEDEISKKGAISIGDIMYDLPHLKWAQKLNSYLNYFKKEKG